MVERGYPEEYLKKGEQVVYPYSPNNQWLYFILGFFAALALVALILAIISITRK